MALFKKATVSEKTPEERMIERNVAKLQDYKRVFSSEQGKRVLSDLIASHYMMGSTFTRGAGSEQDMAFKEGQRQVVLRIMTIMDQDPGQVAQAIKESNEYVRSK